MPDSTDLPPSLVLSLPAITKSLGDVTRWRILGELSKTHALMVSELARKLGRTETVISKHMAVLRKAGAVAVGQARMYHVPEHFRVEPGVLDFGYGRLRMAAVTEK